MTTQPTKPYPLVVFFAAMSRGPPELTSSWTVTVMLPTVRPETLALRCKRLLGLSGATVLSSELDEPEKVPMVEAPLLHVPLLCVQVLVQDDNVELTLRRGMPLTEIPTW